MNAADLNNLLAKYMQFGLSCPVRAKYAGRDAITGAPFPAGTSVRFLDGKPLLTTSACGASGVDVLCIAERGRKGCIFVDVLDGDGVYFTVNAHGHVVEFTVSDETVTAKSSYGRTCSLAAYKAQKLRHQVALIKCALVMG